MSTPAQTFAPGAYKFTVKSAEHAVTLIREKLGANARVLSVRTIEPTGFRKFFSAPQLEVIAQIDAPLPSAGLVQVSAEPALPPAERPELPKSPRASSAPPPPVTENNLSGLLRRSGITEMALTRLQATANWKELNLLPLHRGPFSSKHACR